MPMTKWRARAWFLLVTWCYNYVGSLFAVVCFTSSMRVDRAHRSQWPCQTKHSKLARDLAMTFVYMPRDNSNNNNNNEFSRPFFGIKTLIVTKKLKKKWENANLESRESHEPRERAVLSFANCGDRRIIIAWS